MMKRNFVLALGLSLCGILAGAAYMPKGADANARQEVAPAQRSRVVKGQTLSSTWMPPVNIKFDKSFKYAGTQSFVLYDVANAEQHFFVDADQQGRIRRLYWVQFEGYLPSNTHKYNYKSTKTVNIGGFDFIADSYPRNVPEARRTQRPDSDGARAIAFLEGKGFRLASDDLLMQRLVHMVDESKRDELMIIYLEDMTGTGYKAADFAEGGRGAAQWESVSKGLLARAQKGMKISKR